MPKTSRELRWDNIGIVKAVTENLAGRARKNAAQERALIRDKLDVKMMLRSKNYSSRIYRHLD